AWVSVRSALPVVGSSRVRPSGQPSAASGGRFGGKTAAHWGEVRGLAVGGSANGSSVFGSGPAFAPQSHKRSLILTVVAPRVPSADRASTSTVSRGPSASGRCLPVLTSHRR